MYNTLNNPSAHPSYSHYYLLSPSTLFFFAHLIVFCTSYCFLHILLFCTFLFHCTFYSYFSFFTIYMLLCCVTLYNSYFYYFALSTERTWLDYISLLIIPCIIYYVTNKETLTLRVSHKHSLPKKLAVHRVLYSSMLTGSWVEGKSVEEKDVQPTERTAALWGLSSKIDSRIWVNFTRNGLRLWSRHQEPPHTDVSRNLATVVVRGVLPGLRRRITGLLPSGPKMKHFQIRASFVFHLETNVQESGGRVEKLIAQVAWSPVLSFHSLWWFGVQCHLLVLVHCVFWKCHCTRLPIIFLGTSCFLLLTSFLKMLISFSSSIWHLPTLPKAPKVG